MVKSISEILKEAGKIRKTEDRVAYLKANMSMPLKNIVIACTDKKKIKFLLPEEAPPYTPSEAHENYGMLLREARKLKYFVDGWCPPNVHQIKREQIFIEMLESVHKDDAEVLLQMIQQKPFKGITKEVIKEAFDYELTK